MIANPRMLTIIIATRSGRLLKFASSPRPTTTIAPNAHAARHAAMNAYCIRTGGEAKVKTVASAGTSASLLGWA
jgi:hypothetical protein